MTGGIRSPNGTRPLTTNTDLTARLRDTATDQLIDWQTQQLPNSELANWFSPDHELLRASDRAWRWLGAPERPTNPTTGQDLGSSPPLHPPTTAPL